MKERITAILSDPANQERWASLPVRSEKKTTGKADLNKRSHDYMRGRGYWAYRADYWDDRMERQHDFLGIFDFVCFGSGETVGMQLTTASNRAARREKILAAREYRWVKDAGWRVLLLTWKKELNGRWSAREEWL